jgi:NADH-quinone oxidoreductase subunit N
MSLCLLSLAGIPATAGFVGKLVVFQAGVAAGFTWLVVIGVASSVIAAFFYLRIVGTMFLEEPVAGSAQPIVTAGLSAGMSVAVALVVFLGLQPALLLELARNAAVLVR